jgi:hypothetical protein
MHVRSMVGGVAVGLLLFGALAQPAALEAQGPDGRWPLQPNNPGNRLLAPFMEGWYANEDGTYSISFGYRNSNQDTLEIPVGPDDFIEPAEFNGMQATTFFPGHQRGVFAVTLPASMKDTDVWWTLRKANGEVTRVPGRTNAVAYQLDWYARPHGTVPPRVSFDSQDGEGRGPVGIVSERVLTTSAGSPVALSVNVREISERDRSDFRFAEALTLRVVWSKHQGPGMIEFTRHASTPAPEVEENGRGGGDGGFPEGNGPGPEVITVPDDVESTVRVLATFSEPGEYMVRAQVDNWRATDSSGSDQCCWTNGYVRVIVR